MGGTNAFLFSPHLVRPINIMILIGLCLMKTVKTIVEDTNIPFRVGERLIQV